MWENDIGFFSASAASPVAKRGQLAGQLHIREQVQLFFTAEFLLATFSRKKTIFSFASSSVLWFVQCWKQTFALLMDSHKAPNMRAAHAKFAHFS